MSFSTKIVFPAPPPTTNTLTPQQRMQLIRSTKKLGRILGTTPQILDGTLSLPPLHIHLPFKDAERHSGDSYSSHRSSEPLYRTVSSTSYKSSRSSKKQPAPPCDTWPKQKPPMLRLAVPPSTLETIPASPLAFSSSTYSPARSHSRSLSEQQVDGQSFTIRAPPTASPMSPSLSPTAPSFTIPSLNTERRRKMERLRRKLGDDVPLDLVFPSDSSEDSEDTDVLDISPSSSVSSSPTSSPGSSPMRSKPKSGRISNARDSIAYFSPHRAPRASFIPPEASRPVPPPPAPVSVSVTTHTVQERDTRYVILPEDSANRANRSESQGLRKTSISSLRGREHLSAIMESPNEHSAGCAQEFGIASGRSMSGRAYEDDWSGSEKDDSEFQVAVQMWSTRRGYGGWPRM